MPGAKDVMVRKADTDPHQLARGVSGSQGGTGDESSPPDFSAPLPPELLQELGQKGESAAFPLVC